MRDQNYSLVQVSPIEISYLGQDMVLEEAVVHLSSDGVGTPPELEPKGAVLPQSTEDHEFGADSWLLLDKVVWPALAHL